MITMPYKSDSQRRWANSPSGIKAMGKKKVNEFNKASKGTELPERLAFLEMKSKKKKK